MASSFNSPGTPTNHGGFGTSSAPQDSASSTTGSIGQELREDAKNLAGTATQRLQGEVDARKGGAVSQVQSLSSVLGETAQNLGDETPSWLRSALEQGAQSLDQFAKSIEQKDARALGRDAQRLARENPGTFLAGCTLAGFLAARVFRAGSSSAATGSETRDERSNQDDFNTASPTYVPEAVS